MTVTIPVYNGLPHLTRALDSVLAQSYTDLDIVVIDNASTDDSFAHVTARDDERIRVIRNETNLGMLGNWNKCLAEATASPYWKLVCADDELDPSCVASEVAAFEANPSVAVVASRRRVVDDHGRVIVRAHGLGRMRGVVDGRMAVRRSVAAGTNLFGEPTSVALRSSIVDRIGLFDATHEYCLDFDLWARALLEGDLFALRETNATFRVGPMSNSLTLARRQRRQVIDELRKLHEDGRFGVRQIDVAQGSVRAAVLTEARMALYKVLERRRAPASAVTV